MTVTDTIKNDVYISAAKPDPFFGLNPILDPKFGLNQVVLALRVEKWVQSGGVGLKKGSNSGSTL